MRTIIEFIGFALSVRAQTSLYLYLSREAGVWAQVLRELVWNTGIIRIASLRLGVHTLLESCSER